MLCRPCIARLLGCVLVAATVFPIPSRAQVATYLTQWGSRGSGDGQFIDMGGIAVDPSGNVFVADFGNNRIQKFTNSGAYLGQWGTRGSAAGQFYGPDGIAIDAAGDIYVVDSNNYRVQQFTNTGVFLRQWGTMGVQPGQFYPLPKGVAVDASGNVFVSDCLRVQKFSGTGTFITQWGTANGDGPGEFRDATGLAVDASGNVYVGDTGGNFGDHDRVQKFTNDGTYLTQWGTPGSGDGQFGSFVVLGGPWGLAVDPGGNVYVVDFGNHRVEKFTETGTYLGQWGTLGTGNGQFQYPYSIATGRDGTIYVGEQGTNNRVQVFGAVATPTVPTSWGRLKSLYR